MKSTLIMFVLVFFVSSLSLTAFAQCDPCKDASKCSGPDCNTGNDRNGISTQGVKGWDGWCKGIDRLTGKSVGEVDCSRGPSLNGEMNSKGNEHGGRFGGHGASASWGKSLNSHPSGAFYDGEIDNPNHPKNGS